jgi:hypothetical protein
MIGPGDACHIGKTGPAQALFRGSRAPKKRLEIGCENDR